MGREIETGPKRVYGVTRELKYARGQMVALAQELERAAAQFDLDGYTPTENELINVRGMLYGDDSEAAEIASMLATAQAHGTGF